MGNRATYGSDWASALPSTKLVDMYEYQDGRPLIGKKLFRVSQLV